MISLMNHSKVNLKRKANFIDAPIVEPEINPQKGKVNNILKSVHITGKRFKSPIFNHVIPFDSNMTWVVGENGSGKSSLLWAMMLPDEQITRQGMTRDLVGARGEQFFFFDFERMNPRMHRIENRTANAKTDDIMYQFAVDSASHGEAVIPIIKGIKNRSGTIIFMDEPESGLSPWTQKKLIAIFKEAAKKNQLVVATHSTIFMQSFGKVLDLNCDVPELVDAKDYSWQKR